MIIKQTNLELLNAVVANYYITIRTIFMIRSSFP